MLRTGEPFASKSRLVQRVEDEIDTRQRAGDFVGLPEESGEFSALGEVALADVDGGKAMAYIQRGNRVQLIFICSVDGERKVYKLLPKSLSDEVLRQIIAHLG